MHDPAYGHGLRTGHDQAFEGAEFAYDDQAQAACSPNLDEPAALWVFAAVPNWITYYDEKEKASQREGTAE